MPEFDFKCVTEFYKGHIDDDPQGARIGAVIYDLRFPPWRDRCPFVMSPSRLSNLRYVKLANKTTLPPLSRIFLDVAINIHYYGLGVTQSGLVVYFQRKYELPRKRARALKRIIWNWLWFDYFPTEIIRRWFTNGGSQHAAFTEK
jgi:hypothetical protein